MSYNFETPSYCRNQEANKINDRRLKTKISKQNGTKKYNKFEDLWAYVSNMLAAAVQKPILYTGIVGLLHNSLSNQYFSNWQENKLTLLWMGGGTVLIGGFSKMDHLLVNVKPRGNQTFPSLCPVGRWPRPSGSKSASHKAKGAYLGLKFKALKAHPI